MNLMLTVYSIFQRTKIFSRIIFCKIRNSFIPISNRFAYFRLTSESSPIILNLSCRLFLKTRTLIYHACKIASYPDLYNQKTQANYRNRTALPRRFLSFGKTMFFGLSSFLCQSVDNYRAQESEFMHRERLLS